MDASDYSSTTFALPAPAATPVDHLSRPPQFSLRGLLLAMALASVTFATLPVAGVFGLAGAYLIFVVASFWRVKPQNVPLKRWAVDVFAGVVFPILCFYYDADGGASMPNALGMFYGGPIQVLLYVAVALQLTALVSWWICPRHLLWLIGALAGVLMVGALLALSIAVAMIPLTLMGLLFLIGVLGLAPWYTSFIFFRNAREAFRTVDRSGRPSHAGVAGVVLGALIAVAFPMTAEWWVRRDVRHLIAAIENGNSGGAVAATYRLKLVAPPQYLKPVRNQYFQSTDAGRQAEYASTYREITRRGIDEYESD